MDGVCDMCWARGDQRGIRLLKCKVCGLFVHDKCYAYTCQDNHQSNEFTCFACAAVGTEVQIRKRDGKERKRYLIKERPTECCLCSVDDGKDVMHAMHPLFDDHGLRGRQILLPPEKKVVLSRSRAAARSGPVKVELEERPAWVHTLCALACSYPKYLYPCAKDGDYGQDSDDEDDDRLFNDDSSVNSCLGIDGTEEYIAEATATHFVWMNERWYGGDHVIIRDRKEIQTFRCLCGSKDLGSFRIPLQCKAGDDDEWERGKNTHKEMNSKEMCFVASHVGCAFYGHDEAGMYPDIRRVYFGPENEDADVDGYMAHYCPAHAKDLQAAGVSEASTVYYPSNMIARYMSRPVAVSTRQFSVNMPIRPRGCAAVMGKMRRSRTAPSAAATDQLSRSIMGDSRAPRRSTPTVTLSRKELRDEIVTDLMEQLQRTQDPEERFRIVKSCQAKWRPKAGNMTAEAFKTLFEKCRKIAVRENAKPNSNATLHKRNPRRVDVDSLLAGLDSIQKGTAKGMIEVLSDAVRRLDDLKDAANCAKEVRTKLRGTHSHLSNEAFKEIWMAAKKVVSSMYDMRMPVKNAQPVRQSAQEAREEAARKPPPDGSLDSSATAHDVQEESARKSPHDGSLTAAETEQEVQEETARKSPPDGSLTAAETEQEVQESARRHLHTKTFPTKKKNDDVVMEEEVGIIDPTLETPAEGDGNEAPQDVLDDSDIDKPSILQPSALLRKRARSIAEAKSERASEAMSQEFMDATQSIYETMSEQRHLPLQTILENARDDFMDRLKLPTFRFEAFWRRVVERAERDWWLLIQHGEPIDWGFLTVGESYDSTKAEEYVGNVDIISMGL